MGAVRTNKRATGTSRMRKLSLEENRAKNLAKPVGNKTIEAFLKSQGSFVVYDPNFM